MISYLRVRLVSSDELVRKVTMRLSRHGDPEVLLRCLSCGDESRKSDGYETDHDEKFDFGYYANLVL